ncbi:MAG TPA: vitamin B12 dependent-methionine synthase activation domain-containing protein [Mesotoga sp.]|nr:vitamin B12 dependent-methionine synthase activation domain-containing protein [Mesotoga sp.]
MMIDRDEDITVLREIPFSVDSESLQRLLRIRPGSQEAYNLDKMADFAREFGKPKVIYRTVFIDGSVEDSISVGGVVFKSALLSRKLESVGRVLPFVVTSGRELEEYPLDRRDFLEAFLWDSVKEYVLHEAVEFFRKEASRRNLVERLVWMSPGSGDAEIWPLQQQKELFSLIGNVKEEIGVELKESFLMIPTKSISGIAFQSEKDYRSCMVCRRVNCHYRSAPFDRKLRDSLE